jgi:hypothetical protein
MSLRAVALVPVLLIASACSEPDDKSAERTPAAGTTPASSAAPTQDDSPDNGAEVLIAVVQQSGSLELWNVDRTTHVSKLVRALKAPAEGAQAIDVAMADGTNPVICASWNLTPSKVHGDLETTLSCYPRESIRRIDIRGVMQPIEIALNSDGTRIAWSQASGESNPIFSTGRLSDGHVTGVQRRRGRANEPDDAFTGTDVQDLAWADDSHVLVSTAVQSDDGPRLFHVDVDREPGRGWLEDAAVVQGPTDGGYTTYDGVQSANATTALADKRAPDHGDDAERPPDQAVRIDLTDGRVLQTIATAAKGRNLVSVSGTAKALVYVTGASDGDGWTDTKAYLRLPRESRGTPITGLPTDFQTVVTQG